MTRAFKYALYPTVAQERVLESWLALGAELYNAALQERRDAWRRQRVSVGLYDQQRALAEVRRQRPEFGAVPISALRGWLRRLDRTFQAFFRRVKNGDAPGFPRFKNSRRFDVVDIDDLGGAVPIAAGGKRVKIPLLGKVRFKQHRRLRGTPKAMRIRRDGSRWYVIFQCRDVPMTSLLPTGREVGIDLGLSALVATSDGELVPAPQLLASGARQIRVAHRRVTRRKRGSRRRLRAAALLAAKHRRIKNLRREHAIGVARSLVSRYDTIYMEKLNMKGLVRGMLAGPVHDAAWSTFTHWLDVKAEEAGREVVRVDPRGTSQLCSACGATVRKTLSERTHRCPCGYVADRDVNAARVILGRGLRLRRGDLADQAPMTREASTLRPSPSTTTSAP